MARDERAGFYDGHCRSREHPDAAHSSGIRAALPSATPPLAADVFLRIAEAYQSLEDESARKQYIASLGLQMNGVSLRLGTESASSAPRLSERTTRRSGA